MKDLRARLNELEDLRDVIIDCKRLLEEYQTSEHSTDVQWFSTTAQQQLLDLFKDLLVKVKLEESEI